MKHKLTIALLVALATSAATAQAVAQSAPYTEEDPAKLFGYEIEAKETDSTQDIENALRAVKRARETAEEVKMISGANRFHFVALKPESMDVVRPELAKRQTDVSRLQAAIESSALFYTAMRSEGVAARDIIGAELADGDSGLSSEKGVTIYLAP